MDIIGNFLARTGGDFNDKHDLTSPEEERAKHFVILPIHEGKGQFHIEETGELVTKDAIFAIGVNLDMCGKFLPEESVNDDEIEEAPMIGLYQGGPSTMNGELLDLSEQRINIEDIYVLSTQPFHEGQAPHFSQAGFDLFYSEGSFSDIGKMFAKNFEEQCIGFFGVIIFSKDTIEEFINSGKYVAVPYSEEILFAKDRGNVWNMCMEKLKALKSLEERKEGTPTRPTFSAAFFSSNDDKFEGNA